MKDRFKLNWFLCCLISYLSLMQSLKASTLEEQRISFQTARAALQAGKVEEARLLLPPLKGYPLASWLEAQILTVDFDQVSDAGVAKFI